jgi:ribosomal protein S18 acetylase RimI-like enzyme
MTATTVAVRLATHHDLNQVSDVLADAFTADPTVSWIVGDAARRRPGLEGFFRAGLATLWLRHHCVLTTDDGSGAAIWLPPEGQQPSAEELDQVMAAWQAAWGEDFDAFLRFLDAMEAGHPHEPHYYLLAIGTRPALHSRGVGSTLLKAMLDPCDAERIPAYLEATTERSRDLYQRHGFATVAPLMLPAGPTLYRMWREPRS